VLLSRAADQEQRAPAPNRQHVDILMSDTLQMLLERRSGFLAFVQSRVHDRALAEDILQAAYMRAMEHGDSLRDADAAEAWFYSVLRNAVVDNYRRRSAESGALDRWLVELGGPNAKEPSTDGDVTPKFVCGCIQQVLPSLRPAYAEVLREVDLAEEPLGEYARRHKLTPGNAAVRAHRARAALRAALKKTCGSCTIDACLDCVCKVPITE
jgi:RNA polymerase sigma factor (sigma-70 family)